MNDLPKLSNIDDLKDADPEDIREIIDSRQLVSEIDKYLAGDRNKEEFGFRSSGYYSPSSLPYCARALYYQRTGVEGKSRISPGTRIIFDIGHAVHDVLQTYLDKVFGEHFSKEVKCIDDDLHLKGSADGVVEFDNEARLVEIKSISTKGFKTLASPKAEHVMQAHCYAYMLDVPLLWFLYYDKNSGNMRAFDMQFDRIVWGKIQDRLERLERFVEKDTPPPYEVGWGCRECRFKWTCNPPEN